MQVKLASDFFTSKCMAITAIWHYENTTLMCIKTAETPHSFAL